MGPWAECGRAVVSAELVAAFSHSWGGRLVPPSLATVFIPNGRGEYALVGPLPSGVDSHETRVRSPEHLQLGY